MTNLGKISDDANDSFVATNDEKGNIYRKEFLDEHKCLFVENIRWFEDLDFYLQVMVHNPTYELTDIKYYYYTRNRAESAITQVTTQKVVDKIEIIRKWHNYISEKIMRDSSFFKVRKWLEKAYYGTFSFCIPCGEKNVDYRLLEEIIMEDERIWIAQYPNFGKNVKRFGLKKVLPLIKLKEYSKAILRMR